MDLNPPYESVASLQVAAANHGGPGIVYTLVFGGLATYYQSPILGIFAGAAAVGTYVGVSQYHQRIKAVLVAQQPENNI